MGRYRLFTLVALGFTALDQATKAWARAAVERDVGHIDVIPGILSIVHWENTGMAFSLLAEHDGAMTLFYVATVVIIGVLINMLRQLRDEDRLQVWALGILMATAVGNGIDRVVKQSVTDFILVTGGRPPALRAWLVERFGTYAWPAFNIADACLVIGIGLFFVDWLFFQREDKAIDPDPPEEPLEG